MRTNTLLGRVFLAAVFAAGLPTLAQSPAPQGVSGDPYRHCGIDDARSALQARDAAFMEWGAAEGEASREGSAPGSQCEYELWTPGNPATGDPWMFCAEDHFLAGTIESFYPEADPYCSASGERCGRNGACPLDGESCLDTSSNALAFAKRLAFSAQFGPVDKPLKAQAMTRTPTKHAHDAVHGDVIWFQSGFLVHRGPGLYRSVVSDSVDGVVQSEGAALVEIVTHQEHLRRAANGTWKPVSALKVAAKVSEPESAAPLVNLAAAPPKVVRTASRKTHGAAGTFDLPLGPSPFSGQPVEPRQGPHRIVFTFDKPVVAGIAKARGSGVFSQGVTAGVPTFSGSEMSVPLIGAADRGWVIIDVSEVASADGGARGAGSATVGFLLGDVEIPPGSLRCNYTIVDDSDIRRVKASIAQPVTAANFRYDVNANGAITIGDRAIVEGQRGKYLWPIGRLLC